MPPPEGLLGVQTLMGHALLTGLSSPLTANCENCHTVLGVKDMAFSYGTVLYLNLSCSVRCGTPDLGRRSLG